MEEEQLIKEVCFKLDGFYLDEDYQADNDDEILDETEYNKLLSREEIIDAYTSVTNYACSYCNLEDLPDGPIVHTALIFWTAGFLWKKYDIRPNDLVDETVPLGYGDSLIIQAKEMLKPFKSYELTIW